MRVKKPTIKFVVVIGRHGRTCLGSTRADLHRWMINFIERTARARQMNGSAGREQVQPVSSCRRSSPPALASSGRCKVAASGSCRPSSPF